MATRRRRRALTDSERAEKRAAERELMAQAIEQLRGSEGWQRWLRVRRHFHSYSFHNQLLIAYQRLSLPSSRKTSGRPPRGLRHELGRPGAALAGGPK